MVFVDTLDDMYLLYMITVCTDMYISISIFISVSVSISVSTLALWIINAISHQTSASLPKPRWFVDV